MMTQSNTWQLIHKNDISSIARHLAFHQPLEFLRVMDSIMQGLKGVLVYFDDIFVTGSSTDEHLKTSVVYWLSFKKQDSNSNVFLLCVPRLNI